MKKLLLYFMLLLNGLYIFAQQTGNIDFTRAEGNIAIDPHREEVTGEVTYFFDVLHPVDSFYIDARKMTFDKVKLNGKEVKFRNDNSRLWILSAQDTSQQNRLTFAYKAIPEKAMYFTGWGLEEGTRQVWTQGQGRYTSNWFPSFDDVSEKVEFDLFVTFGREYKVLANGNLDGIEERDSLITWKYNMQHPMSSYLLALAIGKYDMIRDVSRGGVPMEMYYYPEDKDKAEPTYRYTKRIFDFLEKEIGIPYPWQNYKQAPVRDFLHAGMENTTLTLFADTFMVDSVGYNDRNYLNVNAHELAHQWFGNMVTARSNEHHWLQEGFATYYALLAEREVFGEDYYYWKLYKSAETLAARSENGKGEAVLNAGAGSLTFYEKGAFVLHRLRETAGDGAFRRGVRRYLEKNKYGTAVTSDFMDEVEKISGKDLSGFTDRWLRDSVFPREEAMASLRKNEFIRKLTDFQEGKISRKKRDELLDSDVYYPLKEDIIMQMNRDSVAVNRSRELFRTGDLHVRQALALSLDSVPVSLKAEYESLLSDPSYVTIENALIKLWMNFHEDAAVYLDRTAGIRGFTDRNIRILWLALALSSPVYPSGSDTTVFRQKKAWKEELTGYTSLRYPYETRQNAFAILRRLGLLGDEEMLENLVKACVHRTWSFAQSSRALLKSLLENETYVEEVRKLIPKLGEKERKFLKGIIPE
ncbi:M1 family peptidase [Sinomicrobium pectinilyticum]|uniref:Aminopeptidase N n=1 Tax=Sinomicrobium pectinilyticum TaxID=1084421 RepID=A0A3N0EGP9_SINP1|nr:M1 family metallopeptidase [Sinomicrobium pectinilyticum]RNL87058.1 M1 family peptidase [Sinomicrobium pectinilyticum]